MGAEGAKGSTLYGPTGPAGSAGIAGQQGSVGEKGAQGNTTDGVAGVVGFSGIAGAQGAQGATGNQGIVGQIGYWEPYKDFNFDAKETRLTAKDQQKVKDIADYLKSNPSLQVGIDGSAVRSRDQGVNNLRVNAIRAALIDAGVSADRIRLGAMGDKDLKRQGRIAVLFTTGHRGI